RRILHPLPLSHCTTNEARQKFWADLLLSEYAACFIATGVSNLLQCQHVAVNSAKLIALRMSEFSNRTCAIDERGVLDLASFILVEQAKTVGSLTGVPKYWRWPGINGKTVDEMDRFLDTLRWLRAPYPSWDEPAETALANHWH